MLKKNSLPQIWILLVLSALLLSLAATGCKNKYESYKPRALGAPGEVLLVIDSHYWKSQAGKMLKEYLESDFPALPQIEPLFKNIRITHEQFQNQFKTHRNILWVSFQPDAAGNQVDYKRNVWAVNQQVIEIVAKDMKGFTQMLNGHWGHISNFFYEGDMKALSKAYNRIYEAEPTKAVREHYSFEIKFPKGFRVKKVNDDFSWFSFERVDSHLGVFTHQCSLDSLKGDDARDFIRFRNKLLKEQVPGPSKGSFMTTEDHFPVTVSQRSFGGREWVELRGLWKVQGDFMGGPFVSYFYVDKENNRLIMLEGYVHAPQKPNKAHFVREVEAVLRTFRHKVS